MKKDMPLLVSVQSNRRGKLPAGKKGLRSRIRQQFRITVGEWKPVV